MPVLALVVGVAVDLYGQLVLLQEQVPAVRSNVSVVVHGDMGPECAGEVALGDAISAKDGVFQYAPGVLRKALEVEHVAFHLGSAVPAGKVGFEERDGVFLRHDFCGLQWIAHVNAIELAQRLRTGAAAAEVRAGGHRSRAQEMEWET